jgi:hypothetical protein
MTFSASLGTWKAQTSALATAAVGLAAIVTLTAPQAALAQAQAPKSAADCRAISDFNLRGQCWDALDQAKQQDTQIEKKKGFGLGIHAPSDSAIRPKKEDRVREERLQQEDLRNLTLTLASVESSPLGRLVLTSTDGAVWEQTDSDPLNSRPHPGDTVRISKEMFGGYMCHVTRWEAVRCQRDR